MSLETQCSKSKHHVFKVSEADVNVAKCSLKCPFVFLPYDWLIEPKSKSMAL